MSIRRNAAAEFALGGIPSTVDVPADITSSSDNAASPSLAIASLSNASPMGERQMLPVQTNITLLRLSFIENPAKKIRHLSAFVEQKAHICGANTARGRGVVFVGKTEFARAKKNQFVPLTLLSSII